MASPDPPPSIKIKAICRSIYSSFPFCLDAIKFEQPHEKLIIRVGLHYNFHPSIHRNFETSNLIIAKQN
ncbi:hypothetical protein Bca4012_038819 [Brassica carinata]|uniref:Uncharacterized protein n=1 Tax=Brassica carinata TaxID=52824 RepID=A0A8X8B7I4_BRACI|nr:hypothetical protein Bca52824_007035 [Brassica carinata]